MKEKRGDDLINFALRWAPFGGPHDDDLLVEFGMTSRTYYNRLARALRVRPASEVGEDMHRTLLGLCYRQEPTSYGPEPSPPAHHPHPQPLH
ncbi:hypothetical protein [Rhodococcus sp. ACPA1]|uniref:hypothetical protein n=1 Tax=Rhodococcus sp. ACPA1 TaxID=2028572 RepID=UPI000BB135F2|nr:hypothetical protein [Rhodococcus sp. ACPA1]PBC54764.1 hypothetical protein CJ177_29205 [Rhodococcus sp. ACPA1]RZK73211.1 MAG: hypothetical protein EOP28_05675 [Rhodococcus sp. (in: high G+C Gram-positive bacteria)]